MVSGSSDAYFSPKCGCSFRVLIFDSDELANQHGWEQCPLHKAAPRLLRALKRIKAQKCYCDSADEDAPDCPHEIAQDAIRKAKPKP